MPAYVFEIIILRVLMHLFRLCLLLWICSIPSQPTLSPRAPVVERAASSWGVIKDWVPVRATALRRRVNARVRACFSSQLSRHSIGKIRCRQFSGSLMPKIYQTHSNYLQMGLMHSISAEYTLTIILDLAIWMASVSQFGDYGIMGRIRGYYHAENDAFAEGYV